MPEGFWGKALIASSAQLTNNCRIGMRIARLGALAVMDAERYIITYPSWRKQTPSVWGIRYGEVAALDLEDVGLVLLSNNLVHPLLVPRLE